jgi:hypothetical protein
LDSTIHGDGPEPGCSAKARAKIPYIEARHHTGNALDGASYEHSREARKGNLAGEKFGQIFGELHTANSAKS